MTKQLFYGLLGLFISGAAFADIELRYQALDKTETVLQLSGDVVRMDRSGEPTYMLYQHAKRQLNMIDSSSNQGQSLSPESIKAMAAHTQKIRSQLQARMAGLTERQQQLLKQQLGGMASLLEEQPSYQVLREGDATVGDIRCRLVKLQINQQPSYQYCVAQPNDIGIQGAELAALEGLINTLAEVAAQMGGGDNPLALVSIAELGGVPVQMTSLKNGASTQLVSQKLHPIDPARLALPPSLKLQPLAPTR